MSKFFGEAEVVKQCNSAWWQALFLVVNKYARRSHSGCDAH
jgi:hypothetical protein